MARKVLLAREFDHTLDTLTDLTQEVNGVLLYRLQENYCPVEAIFMTGKGTEGHVKAEQERMDMVDEFFRRNPDYQFVKFHTHSRGTIRTFGHLYATNFSGGDIASYDEQLRTNPEFIGMVVTPITKLLYAPDNPTLRVVSGFPSDANNRIQGELAHIAGALGYDMNAFQATKE